MLLNMYDPHRYCDYHHFRDGETETKEVIKAELESGVKVGFKYNLSPKHAWS